MNGRISPAKADRQVGLRIAAGAIAYVALRILSEHLMQGMPQGGLRTALAVFPALPVLWMLWSVHLHLTRTDELHRRVHMQALGVAAGVTAAFSIVYGLLEESAGFPYLSVRWGIMLIGLTWVASGMVLWRRYK
jgi:hypothetical protein